MECTALGLTRVYSLVTWLLVWSVILIGSATLLLFNHFCSLARVDSLLRVRVPLDSQFATGSMKLAPKPIVQHIEKDLRADKIHGMKCGSW